MKTKNRLLALLAIIAFAIGMSASNVLADTFTAQASGNWGTLATWYNTTLGATATTLPGASDNVVIPATFTVSVNQNVEINNLSIGTTGTGIAVLKPDASSSRQITIDGDLTVGQGSTTNLGKILLDDGTGTGASSGRLSWVFTGSGTGVSAGTSTITIANDNSVASVDEEAIAAAYVKFYNLSFNTGNAVLKNTAATNSGFYVYGDFTVTSVNFSIDYTGSPNIYQTIYLNTYSSATKSVNNSGGDIKFYNLNIPSGAYITTAKDFTVEKNLTIAGSLAQTSTSSITMTGNGTTLTNSGTYTIGSNASLNINSTSVTLANNITNMSGAITVADGKTFVITPSKTITGTGSFTLGTGSTLSLSNTGGFASTIALSGIKSVVAGILQYEGGTTGITASGLTEVGGIIANGTVTTAETFSIAKGLTVNGGKSFTASAGTITFTGTGTITTTTASSLTFYNLILNNSGTITLATNSPIVNGSLKVDATGGINYGATTNGFLLQGSGNFSIPQVGTAAGVGTYCFYINTTGTYTLDSNIALGATGTKVALNAGTLDLKSYNLTGSGVNGVTFLGGTVKTASATGLVGNFPSYAVNFLNTAAAVSYYFNGTSSQTSFGFTFPNLIGATTGGSTVANNINVVNAITVGGTAAITTHGSTSVAIASVSGAFTVNSGATCDLSGLTVGVTFINGASIVNNASATSLKFYDITIGAANATIDVVTTSTSFYVTHNIVVDGTQADHLDCTAGTIYLSGAAVNINGTAATGILNFKNLSITNTGVSATNANMVNLNVSGDLSFAGSATFTANPATILTLSGASAKLSNTNSATVTLGGLVVSGGVTATGDYTLAGSGANLINVTTSFIATSGSITLGAAHAVTNSGVLKFYNLVVGAAATTASSFYVNNDISRTAGSLTASAGTITMDPTDGAGTITSGGAANLVIFNMTIASGSVTIDELTGTALAGITVNTGATMITGSTEPALKAGGTATSTLTISANATWRVNGANGFKGACTFTGVGSYSSTANYILGPLVANAGFDITTTNPTQLQVMNNLTSYANAPLAGLGSVATNITINGNLIVTDVSAAGSRFGTAVAEKITFGGVASQIINTATGTTSITIGQIATSGTAVVTTAADITISGTAALTMTAGASFTASNGTITFSNAAPVIDNATTPGTLVFNNLALSAGTVKLTSTTSSFTINGNLDMGATGSSILTTGGTITFGGANKTITTKDDAVVLTPIGLNLWNVLFTGSYTQIGSHRINVQGATFNVSGSFTQATAQSFDFANSATITNTGSLTFGTLLVDRLAAGSKVVTTASSLNIAGGLTLAATSNFTASAGTITFTGAATQTITPAQNYAAASTGLSLNDVVVNGTYSIAGAFISNMTGSLTVTGSLTPAAASTIKFTGTTAKTITNAGTLELGNLIIDNIAGNNVSTTTDMIVDGDIAIGGAAGGTFTATAGNLTVGNGTTAGTITNNNTSVKTLTLYSLTHAGTLGLTIPTVVNAGLTDIYLKGNLANTSAGLIDFTTIPTKVTFNGAGEQTISKTGAGNITFDNVTVNNSGSGIKLSGFGTEGDLTVNHTMKIQQGYVDLNGLNIIKLAAGANTTGYLQEAAGNTVRNSGTADGYITKLNNLGTLANINVGGLGAQFTTTSTPTSVKVNRYHIARTVAGEAGISRYFEVTTGGAGAGSTTLTFKYDSTELNGLNEANLNLLSSSSATTGWTKRTATLDASVHYLRGTFATDFNTATTSYWTASAPSQVAISKISKGVGSLRFNDGTVDGYANTKDTLTATSTNKAILGFKISTTNSAQVTGATVTLSRSVTAGTEFTKMYLYSSTDDDYSTSDDNTALDTVTVATGTSVVFTGLAETISAGGARNYFVVADIGSSVTTSTLPVTASVLSTDITLSNSVPVQNTITGPAFSFQPGVILTKVVNGVSESPLVAGETNKALIGFGAKGTSATGFTTFSLSFDQDSATIANLFSSWRLYRSTSINFDYTASGQNTLVKTGVLSSTGVKFDITTTSEALSTSDKYYFVVVDVNGGVDPTDLRITPSIAPSSVHSYNLLTSGSAVKNSDEEAGPVSTTSLVGNTYDFVNSKLIVSTENQIPAGNIGKGLSNQRLFGFTLTSLYSNSAVVSACSVKVDLSTAVAANFSNWRLWNDANSNSFPDATETNFSGIYSNGYVVFPMTSVTQTITSSKKYIVTANVASTASSDGTVTISIPDQSYITATSPAIVENGGAWTGNVQTIKTPGTATKVVLSPQYVNTVVTGGTIALSYQLQDANGTPVNAGTAVALTLSASNAGTGFTSGNTGNIAVGSDFVTLNPVVTSAGITGESISCANASSLATPLAASPITITATVPVATISGAPVTLTANSSSPGTALTVAYNSTNVSPNANVIIVMRAGAMPVAPTDGVTYVGLNDQNIGDASSVNTTGDGTYVVYNGVGNAPVNFSVYGLTPSTTYYFTTYVNSSSTAGLQKYATSLSSNNPVSRATTADDFATHGDKGVAASIQTDVNVPGSITTSNEQAWYKFYVNSSRSNLYIHLSDITNSKNLKIELWNAAGTKMIRYASSVSAQNQTILINDAPAGTYLVKVTGYDDSQYSTSYTLRVNTKANANDYYSQPSR